MNKFNCLTNQSIPDTRIDVFISSAMNDENGVNWSDIRNKVCNKLKTCIYINPFTIEKHISEIPSEQYFLFQVQQCDVLILLLKEEIRPGVHQEIETAKKYKKAIIPYFFKGAAPDSKASKLKESFIKSDYCTFKLFDNFNNLEGIIANDLLNNIIDKYKYTHYIDSKKETETANNIENISYKEIHNPVTKTTLKCFKNCYGILFNGIIHKYKNCNQYSKENSLFYEFGSKMLEWILYGKEFVSTKEIESFTNRLNDFYGNLDWIDYRWKAIENYLAGNLFIALQFEEKALNIARKNEVYNWITNNILIDCRNLECESQYGFFQPSKYQKELNKTDEIIYVPLLDTYESRAYDMLLDEDIKLETATPNQHYFGGNIEISFEKIENYIFVALLYGSLTNIIIARDILSKMVYKYGKIYNLDNLIFESVKLMILSGKVRLLKSITIKEWDNIYNFLSSNADELWHYTDNTILNKSSIKFFVIQTLGQYISDENFIEIEIYLLNLSLKIEWDKISNYLKAIFYNMNRISNSSIVKILINILKKYQINLEPELSQILISINVKSVSKELLETFEKLLEKNLRNILDSSGTLQFIANLVKQCPDIFMKLELYLPKNIDPIEKDLYDINVGKNQDWYKVVNDLLIEAEKQLEMDMNPKSICAFSTNPYKIIQQIIKNNLSKKVIDIIKSDFISLAIKVFNSNAPGYMKENCIECLIDVIIVLDENNITLRKDLLKAIQSLDIKNQRYSYFLSKSTSTTTLYRIIMLKNVLNSDVKRELLIKYLSFIKQNDIERYVLSQCIKQYIHYCLKVHKKIDKLFLLMIVQMCDDKYYKVRKEASECLILLLSTPFRDIAKQKLVGLISDSSPNIRYNILDSIDKFSIEDCEFRNEILEYYCKDAHYNIRKKAQELCEK